MSGLLFKEIIPHIKAYVVFHAKSRDFSGVLSTMHSAPSPGSPAKGSRLLLTGSWPQLETTSLHHAQENCSGRSPVILQHNLKEPSSSEWKTQSLPSITRERQENDWMGVLSTLVPANLLYLMLLLREDGESKCPTVYNIHGMSLDR